MVDKKKEDKKAEVKIDTASFLAELREFARTVGEPCPEGHRLDPSSGACLPMGSLDHTSFTRSLNNDDGPQWRGEVEKENTTFASADETALDADQMDDLESCAEGTVFSFIQRRCVTAEEAELENDDELAADEEGAAPAGGGHEEITQMQPSGRRDTVNHQCPGNMFFDYILRECIPLNKDTVMASEAVPEEFKKEVARFGKVAMTSPDPIDGHIHFVTVNEDGEGMTSVDIGGLMEGYPHSHSVSEFEVEPHEQAGTNYVSRHPGPVNPMENKDPHATMPFGSASENAAEDSEEAAPITTKQRKGLSDSSFGVPGKRKFPLDSCARVRNAMARFNQAKGLTSGEKATLRRKILSRAKACGIEVRNFAKANSNEDFARLLIELQKQVGIEQRLREYDAESAQEAKRGPCPPGMIWASETKRCTQTSGFVSKIVAQHSDIVMKQPEGRRDPVGFSCPSGQFYDFTRRRCLPLDPSQKPGTTTTKAEEEEAQSRKLTPQPKGRPARLPQDCPEGTIWDQDLNKCKPLDSRKKTKSEEEDAAIPPQFLKNIKKKGKNGKKGDDKNDKNGGGFPDFLKKKKSKSGEEDAQGQTTPSGPGKDKDSKGCGPGEFMNPITKKCMPRKGAFKGKSETENAEHAQPGNREGLVDAPAGKVRHPSDCPAGTAWDGVLHVCKELDSMEKVAPGNQTLDPKMHSSVEGMTISKVISHLDEIIKQDAAEGRKEKERVLAKDLPNAAFPPSAVSSTRRSLMHHTPGVEDPYDNETVDIGRLRNALARSSKLEGFSVKAAEDARDHLLYHAREIIKAALQKKS